MLRKSEEYKKKKREARDFLYAAVGKQVPNLEDAGLKEVGKFSEPQSDTRNKKLVVTSALLVVTRS